MTKDEAQAKSVTLELFDLAMLLASSYDAGLRIRPHPCITGSLPDETLLDDEYRIRLEFEVPHGCSEAWQQRWLSIAEKVANEWGYVL